MKTAEDKSRFFGLMRESFREWYFEDCPIAERIACLQYEVSRDSRDTPYLCLSKEEREQLGPTVLFITSRPLDGKNHHSAVRQARFQLRSLGAARLVSAFRELDPANWFNLITEFFRGQETKIVLRFYDLESFPWQGYSRKEEWTKNAAKGERLVAEANAQKPALSQSLASGDAEGMGVFFSYNTSAHTWPDAREGRVGPIEWSTALAKPANLRWHGEVSSDQDF